MSDEFNNICYNKPYHNDLERLKDLELYIQTHPNTNINIIDKNGYTPLIYFCWSYSIENNLIRKQFIDLLIRSFSNIDINIQGSFGYTALHILCFTECFDIVFDSSAKNIANDNIRIDIFTSLLQLNPSVCLKDDNGYTILHILCGNSLIHNIDTIKKMINILLKINKDDVAKLINQKDNLGNTALHYICEMYIIDNQNRKDIIQLLLNHGADPDIRNNKGLKPIDLFSNLNIKTNKGNISRIIKNRMIKPTKINRKTNSKCYITLSRIGYKCHYYKCFNINDHIYKRRAFNEWIKIQKNHNCILCRKPTINIDDIYVNF